MEGVTALRRIAFYNAVLYRCRSPYVATSASDFSDGVFRGRVGEL